MNKEILQYRTFQNGVYVRLAMQNTSTGITFDSKEQAKYYIDKEYSNFKFSILDKIDKIPRYEKEYYEFLHCYDEIPACNHWKQKVSPMKYREIPDETDAEAIGLIHNDSRFAVFKGLMLSQDRFTLLDGDSEGSGHWHYAVGVIDKYFDYQIPGPKFNGQFYRLKRYELFLRISITGITCNSRLHFQMPLLVTFVFLIQNK